MSLMSGQYRQNATTAMSIVYGAIQSTRGQIISETISLNLMTFAALFEIKVWL
jgi:hypothetical protein